MIVIPLLLSFFIPMLGWVFITSLAFRKISFFSVFTGMALGLGWSGVIFYIADKFIRYSIHTVTVLDSFLLVLSAYFIYRNKIPLAFESFNQDKFEKETTRVCLLLLGITSFSLIIQVIYHPYGHWDAWMIWNVKARHIAFGGLPRFFQEAYQYLTHPGYPLLLPSIISRGLRVYGSNTLVIPGFIALMYFFILNGLVFSAILKFTGRLFPAVLGMMALFITPHFILETPGQYADIPLACYITLASVLVMHGLKEQIQGYYYILAGLGFGYALFMKNEGLLFLAISAVVLSISYYQRRISWKSIGMILTGVSLAVILLVNLKLSLPREDHLGEISWDFPTLVAQIKQNAPEITVYYFRNLLKTSEFFVLIGIILLLTTYRLSLTNIDRYGVFVILGILSGYTSIYLLVENVEFLLSTSSKRLLLHVYPLVVIIVMSALREYPEHVTSSD